MLQPALALTVRQKNLGNLYIKGLAFTGDFLSSFFRQVGIFDAFFFSFGCILYLVLSVAASSIEASK